MVVVIILVITVGEVIPDIGEDLLIIKEVG
jgi:hypothetical protein